MNSIKSSIIAKVTGIMTGSRRFPFFSPATGLLAASFPYSCGIRLWRSMYTSGLRRQARLSRPVVSIGNLSVGGTGKTPFAIFLAGQLLQRGLRPAIISRGYGACKGGDRAIVVSDGHRVHANANEAGDEPVMMAGALNGVPVVVGPDRLAAGKLAIERFQPDLVLLDDGFQHLRLHRDLDIVLLDAMRPFGNGYLFPRGTLREPKDAIGRSDVIVLTRSDELSEEQYANMAATLQPLPVFRATHKPVIRVVVPAGSPCNHLSAVGFTGEENRAERLLHNAFVFSGLANNHAFHKSIKRMGGTIAGELMFQDHHPYSPKDLSKIASEATCAGAACLITTDKDYVRFQGTCVWPLPLVVIGVSISMPADRDGWETFVSGMLERRIGQ